MSWGWLHALVAGDTLAGDFYPCLYRETFMTIAIIWLVAFAFFFYMFLKRWDASVSGMLDALLPAVMRTDDDRFVLAPALAVLLATAIVSPVEILLIAIIISVITLVGTKLMGSVMSRVDLS